MRTLSAKLVAIELAFLVVALLSIGATLYLSWTLEGSAAAINDAGSLRMRVYRLDLLAEQGGGERLHQALRDFNTVLDRLQNGDPARPLALPQTAPVREQLGQLKTEWADLQPRLQAGVGLTLVQSDRLVSIVDELVRRVERENANATDLLRAAQFGLLALAIAGTVALIYVSFLLVIRPLLRLSEAIECVGQGDLSIRLTVESQDEFGRLTSGFNDMTAKLEESHRTLEARVESKTRDLARQNDRLGALYEMTAFLGSAQNLDELCRGFVNRAVKVYAAFGGVVRLHSENDAEMHIVASEGLSRQFLHRESCLPDDACSCGAALKQSHSIIRLVKEPGPHPELFHCRNEGFQTVVAIPVCFKQRTIGLINLFFRTEHELEVDERHLLETLAQHLGTAIENLRLIEREREMAAFEERNSLAQELHDSIAQSLAFLNIQTQILQNAMKQGDTAKADTSVTEIRAGVQECFADVRELLTHFRTRVGDSLESALRSIVARFERQTGVQARLSIEGSATPLAPDRELQLIHIAQEALSNARKHAHCKHVKMHLERGAVYNLAVEDDGIGFDMVATAALEDHVGLRIMRERAHRAGGTVRIDSRPGQGTKIALSLPLVALNVASG
ncbi:MAG TPA: type IV pili methyl-accepting chemotaxis transducer N-terminal domain-containing protein [Burkholderiales bacterium]|nr:type IV pili methyl-accepting chemotaxis transducer N-terminal domain-containing protein [Burkholderiales bacterium]